MPGDIRAMQLNMDDFQAGVVTKPEFDAKNAEIVATMEARNAELLEEGSKIPTDPMSLLMYAGGLLGTAMGTNKYRDGRRKARGERTGSGLPPPAGPTPV